VKRSLVCLLGLALFAALLAAGCSPVPAARAALQATETAPSGGGEARATLSPDGATVAPEAQPTLLAPTPTLIPDFNCINCHTNADLLMALAVEEATPEAPSEGSG